MKRSNKAKVQMMALVSLAAVALPAIILAAAGPLAGDILVRLVLIACGAVLLARAGGTLRWIGAAFAVLGAWSLLGPAGGSILLLLAACLLYRGARRTKRLYSWSQAFQVSPVSMDTPESRGRFLDEWEQGQRGATEGSPNGTLSRILP